MIWFHRIRRRLYGLCILRPALLAVSGRQLLLRFCSPKKRTCRNSGGYAGRTCKRRRRQVAAANSCTLCCVPGLPRATCRSTRHTTASSGESATGIGTSASRSCRAAATRDMTSSFTPWEAQSLARTMARTQGAGPSCGRRRFMCCRQARAQQLRTQS